MISENKVNQITTRKSNKDKIMDYLKENPKQITTSNLAKNTGIDIKNISRYLKELESENSISRKIVQEGKLRLVYISLITRKKNDTTRKNIIKTTDDIPTPKKKDKIENLEPNSHKLNPKQRIELTNYFNGLAEEVQTLGRTIPLDVKQKIVHDIFENLKNLTKGMKYYLNAWNKRYNRYLKEKPENPLIDEYQDMQETLEILKNLKNIKQELKNAKRKK